MIFSNVFNQLWQLSRRGIPLLGVALSLACAPKISSISPKAGSEGGGTAVTIKGTPFYEGAKVYFGKKECTDVKLSGPKEITCKTPAGTGGTLVDVKVRNPDNFEFILSKAYNYTTDSVSSTSSTSTSTAAAPTLSSSAARAVVNGTITFTTSGGTAPYSYGVTNSSGTITTPTSTTALYTAPASVTGSSTTVTFTVVDAANKSASVELTLYAAITLSNSSSSTLTVGGSSIVITAGGGIGGYTFTAAPQGTLTQAASSSATATYAPPSSLTAGGLASSTVTLTVTDSTSSSTTTTITLVAPSAVYTGGNQSCVYLTDQKIKCFGNNTSGQLGNDDNGGVVAGNAAIGDATGEMGFSLARVNLGTGRTAARIAIGASHMCAVLDNNTLKCWGENGSGQLGLGSTVDKGGTAGDMATLAAITLPGALTANSVSRIAAGEGHTCAILSDNKVYCWGLNDKGQLGYDDMVNKGDGGGANVSALANVNLGVGRTALSIAAGQYHSCAILDNGNVLCWGKNTEGQLGADDVTKNYGDGGAGETMANLVTDLAGKINIGVGRTTSAVTAGYSHTCVIRDDATVVCWGDNTYGQLGTNSTTSYGTAGSNMAALAALNGGAGINLGTSRTAAAICSGGEFNCAILDNATVKCWGRNQSGQLGQGDMNSLGDNGAEMGDNLATVDLGTGRTAISIACGKEHACARLDNWTTKCWGRNTEGQLGQENTVNRGDDNLTSTPDHRMGDNLPILSL